MWLCVYYTCICITLEVNVVYHTRQNTFFYLVVFATDLQCGDKGSVNLTMITVITTTQIVEIIFALADECHTLMNWLVIWFLTIRLITILVLTMYVHLKSFIFLFDSYRPQYICILLSLVLTSASFASYIYYNLIFPLTKLGGICQIRTNAGLYLEFCWDSPNASLVAGCIIVYVHTGIAFTPVFSVLAESADLRTDSSLPTNLILCLPPNFRYLYIFMF